MAQIADVFKLSETLLGQVETEDKATYKEVTVVVGGITRIMFPVSLTTDVNEIAVRVTNIINQSGLVERPVRVALIP